MPAKRTKPQRTQGEGGGAAYWAVRYIVEDGEGNRQAAEQARKNLRQFGYDIVPAKAAP